MVHFLFQVFLKICQYAKENLGPLLWQPRESTSPRSDVYEDLFQMVSGLVILIEDKVFIIHLWIWAQFCGSAYR